MFAVVDPLLIHELLQFCLSSFEPGFLFLDDFHIAVLTRGLQIVLSASHFGFGLFDGARTVILCRRLATVTLDIGKRLFQTGLAINIVRLIGTFNLEYKFGMTLRTTFSRASPRTIDDQNAANQ